MSGQRELADRSVPGGTTKVTQRYAPQAHASDSNERRPIEVSRRQPPVKQRSARGLRRLPIGLRVVGGLAIPTLIAVVLAALLTHAAWERHSATAAMMARLDAAPSAPLILEVVQAERAMAVGYLGSQASSLRRCLCGCRRRDRRRPRTPSSRYRRRRHRRYARRAPTVRRGRDRQTHRSPPRLHGRGRAPGPVCAGRLGAAANR